MCIRDSLRDALQSLGEEHAVIAPAVGSVVGKLNESIAVQQSLYDKLSKAAETIRNKPEEALTSEEELDALLEQSAQSLSKVQSEYEEQVKRNLDGLYASLGDTRSSISGLLKQLDESADGIYTLSGSASSDLSQIKETLDTSGSLLEKAASRLTETVWKLNQAQSSGDFQTLEEIVGGDKESISAFLASPVELETTKLYPIENYGSSMAPFYSTLAIWVRCV